MPNLRIAERKVFQSSLARAPMKQSGSSVAPDFVNSLETANGYAEVWQIVKDTVKASLNRRRDRMMLFLDDLPVQLGAYHPIGTNNIVLNRTLVQIVEATVESKRVVNALIYNLLLHEYLHALGAYSERRRQKNGLRSSQTMLWRKTRCRGDREKEPMGAPKRNSYTGIQRTQACHGNREEFRGNRRVRRVTRSSSARTRKAYTGLRNSR